MTYIILILILIIIILYKLFIYIINRKKCNYLRHLTNEYHYAHFSPICSNNILLYPELIFTNPIYITIKEGQTLFIPKKWWHWITSNTDTISLNFWSKNDNNKIKNPFIINKTYQNDKLLLNKILSFDNIIDNININLNDDINTEYINSKNNKFIITLKGYGNDNNKLNNNLEHVE